MITHAAALLVPVFAELTSKVIALAALLTVACIYVLSERLRLQTRSIPFVTALTLRLARENENSQFISRPLYLAAGVGLALLLFPKDIGYASIFIVACGDPVAAFVGERIGRTHFRRKSIEGFIAGSILSISVSALVLPIHLAVIGGLAGMLLEFSGVFEDNLLIPLGSGLCMTLAQFITVTLR